MKKFLLPLALLILVGHSLTLADLPDLLYPDEIESNATITYYNFSIGSDNYSLVYINGAPSLFAKNGEIVELRSEIREPLWENYSKTYTPENLTEKLEQMRALIDAFNESRFDGTGKEEYGCRLALGEPYAASFDPNRFESIYEYYATVICTDTIGEELNCKDASDLLPGIEGFFTPSYDLDAQVQLIRNNLNISNPSDTFPNMEEILDALDKIEQDTSQIKQNEFRYPLNDETGEPDLNECPECKPLCYEPIYNETALNQLRSLAEELASTTEPLYRFDSIVEEIYTSTKERITFKDTFDLKLFYEKELNSTLKGWDSLKNRSLEVLERLDDPDLEKKVNDVEEFKQKTEAAISLISSESDAQMVEQNLTFLRNTLSIVSQNVSKYESMLEEFDDTMKRVNALYISLENKKSLLSSFDISAAGTKISELSKEEKLTESELKEKIEEAKKLETSLLKEMASERSSLISATFRGLQVYHEALYALAKPLLPSSAEARISFLRLTPLAFSSLVALSFASFVVWLTVPKFYVRGTHKRRVEKSKRGFFFILTGFGAFFIFVLLFTMAFFAYDDAVNRTTLLSFAEKLSNYNHLTIVLKSDSESMKACAAKVAEALPGINTTTMISSEDKCIINGDPSPKAECESTEFPLLILAESSERSIKGSSVGDLYLTVEMPQSEFDSCFIASAFSVINEEAQQPVVAEEDVQNNATSPNQTENTTQNSTA